MTPRAGAPEFDKEEPLDLSPEDRFDFHIDRGTLFLAEQKYDWAIVEFRKLVEIKPKDAEAHQLLGEALYYTGAYDEALKEENKALDLDSEFYRARYGKSIVQAKLGQTEESRREYETAHDTDPLDIDAWYDWATEMSEMGRYDEAIKAFKEILEDAPDYPRPVRVDLGNALIRAGREKEGYQEHKQAKTLDPDDPSIPAEIGDFLLSVGRVDEALEEFRAAQKISPNSPRIYQQIGDIFHHNGKIDEAIVEYRKAIRQAPKAAELHAGLGDLYMEKGMKEEADREHRRAKKLEAEDELMDEKWERMVNSSKW